MSLRVRLALSHLLPLLIVLPLITVGAIYFLQTQTLLDELSTELADQALMIARLAGSNVDIWSGEDANAADFTANLVVKTGQKIMLISTGGQLLASNQPDQNGVDHVVQSPDWNAILDGQTITHVEYSAEYQAQVIDIYVPVFDVDQQLVGIVRMTHQLKDVFQRFDWVGSLLLAMLITELILGIGVGLILALRLEKRLFGISQALQAVADGQPATLLPETGPKEIRSILQAFNIMVGRLHQSQEARRMLLANLVHELGRPLGALNSAVSALANGAVDDVELRDELLEGMRTSIQGMQPLLDNLARLHSQILDPANLKRETVQTSVWLQDVLRIWAIAAGEKNLEWHACIPPDLPPLKIDPLQMAQVIGNLVSNALKYTPTGGTITIQAEATPDSVRISIADTGPGIPPDDQAHIFEPFYRAGNRERFPEGMGLGLSIAREIMQAHNGTLTVKSTLGQGSQFVVCLPTSAFC